MGDRVMDTLGGKMRSAGLNGRAFLVSDENVHDSHGNVAMESLVQAGFLPRKYMNGWLISAPSEAIIL